LAAEWRLPIEIGARMRAENSKGIWMQIRGEARLTWSELTDDDLLQVDGDLDKLAGKLQEKYGYSREEAQREVDIFLNKINARR
jgi:uncharacterized protein YjbJ (UPF0337 family)